MANIEKKSFIHHRHEGYEVQSGIELFHYYDDFRISGIFFVTKNCRFGFRWNRPKEMKPLFTHQCT